jgi:hypothetical protein
LRSKCAAGKENKCTFKRLKVVGINNKKIRFNRQPTGSVGMKWLSGLQKEKITGLIIFNTNISF